MQPMKEIGRGGKSMVRAHIISPIKTYMREIGREGKCMARAPIFFQEVTNMWGNGKMGKKMVKGYTSFQKEIGLKETGSMMRCTEKVPMFTLVEKDFLENGRKVINISMVGWFYRND